jgi:hypothetical protein
MSADDGSGRRSLNRKEFLALGVSAGVLASAGYLRSTQAEAQPQRPPSGQEIFHRGKKIRVEQRGGRPELFIDGKPVMLVNTNGAYRAAGFMFYPQDTPIELGKKMVDYEMALGG